MPKVILLFILSAVVLVLGCGVLPSRTPASSQSYSKSQSESSSSIESSSNESSDRTTGTVWSFQFLQRDWIEISGDLKSLAIQTGQLVILGTGVAQSASYGLHLELLNLITPRELFKKGVDLVWYSPQMAENVNPKKYINVREALQLNGIEGSELISSHFVGKLREGLDARSDYFKDMERFMALAQILLKPENPLFPQSKSLHLTNSPEILTKIENLRLNTLRKIPYCKDLLAAP